MKEPVAVSAMMAVGIIFGLQWMDSIARAADGGAEILASNGDVNGDGTIDISDPVYTLGWLFLGGKPPVAIACASLPATGQTECYDDAVECMTTKVPCGSAAFPGQDGFYQAGCPIAGRFRDDGDGTVADLCTGLVWQKETADVDDNGSLDSKDLLDWPGALRYCDRLNLADHDDWRLPNIRELLSIVDFGRFLPGMDLTFEAEPEFYWSSTSWVGDPSDAWAVHFRVGAAILPGLFMGLTGPGKDQTSYIRAVRGSMRQVRNGDVNGDGTIDISDAVYTLGWLFLGGEPPVAIDCASLPATGQTGCYGLVEGEGWVAVPCEGSGTPGRDGSFQDGCSMDGRFVDGEDGTVEDLCTGLVWQKDAADVNADGSSGAEDLVDWESALRYCEGLSFAGRDDWRLPNIRELESIVDYGRSPDLIDPIFGKQFDLYWSSSSYADCPSDAWFVFFDLANMPTGGAGKGHTYAVRAVRDAD